MDFKIVHTNDQDEVTLISNIPYDNYNIVQISNCLFLTDQQIYDYKANIKIVNDKNKYIKQMKQLSNDQCKLHNIKVAQEAEDQRYLQYEVVNDLRLHFCQLFKMDQTRNNYLKRQETQLLNEYKQKTQEIIDFDIEIKQKQVQHLYALLDHARDSIRIAEAYLNKK